MKHYNLSDKIGQTWLSRTGLTVGSRLMTLEGDIPVEELRPGDRIVTRDQGAAELTRIAFRDVDLTEAPDLAPIRIPANALGPDKPFDMLYLDPNQTVTMRHPLFDLYFGEREVLIRAGDLTEIPAVEQVTNLTGITYIHLGFDSSQLVYSSNLVLGLAADDQYLERQVLAGGQARLAVSSAQAHITGGTMQGFPLH